MIPLLYESDAESFETFGLGALGDTVSCKVTEERNGAFELVLEYPASGRMFKELQEERLIKAKPNDTADDQVFRIYRITTPLKGIVKVYAQHISYDLATTGVIPWSSQNISPSLAMERFFNNTATEHSFTCETDLSSGKPFSVRVPQSVRACLGGTEGSMLDVWGGEYEWDNFHVILHQNRGRDTGVFIEYGKNLTAFEHNRDNSNVYTHLLPYAVYTDEEQVEHVVTLPEVLLPITGTELSQTKTLIKDMTGFFDSSEGAITEEMLRGKSNQYIQNNPLGTVLPDMKISFEPLWAQPEYAEVLEKVSLCDTVTVRHTPYGITVKTKVITTVYDTLNERYSSITLGSPSASFINTVSGISAKTASIEKKVERFPALIGAAVKDATGRITGQDGGYIILNSRDGQPYELLITDNPDIDEAENVWRWNLSGLGFSSTGYGGEYELAITSDGQIVADFITSGTLIANLIKAGVISSLDGTSYWDIETGTVVLKAYTTTETAQNITESIEGIQDEITVINEKSADLQSSVDGLTSYVGTMTERVETVSDELGKSQQTVLDLQSRMTELEQSVDGLSIKVTNEYVGGINLVENSAGLNGVSDEWATAGTVITSADTDIQNNTASGSSFVLSEYSSITQTIRGIVPGRSYSISFRSKKENSSYTSYLRVQYNVGRHVRFAETNESYGWTDFSGIIEDVQDSTIQITVYNRAGTLYISDIMLTEGETLKKWTPAPNEIYTNEVKIDKRGIEVSNSSSSQRTVITNTEFAGYYNEEIIFTLNKDETQTKKTTVDGELTVGKTKFIPTADHGINIVVLD